MRSLGVITFPEFDKEKSFWEQYYDGDLDDKVQKLQSKSSFCLVTLKDKTKIWTARVNYNGGVCDDCKEFGMDDVHSIEGFKA